MKFSYTSRYKIFKTTIGRKKISKTTIKSYSTSKGKDPKDPREGNFLEICLKDFKIFKEKDGDQVIELLNNLIKDRESRVNKSDLLKQQKSNLINVKNLIREGREGEAFKSFFRAFPYCMPYRSHKSISKS